LGSWEVEKKNRQLISKKNDPNGLNDPNDPNDPNNANHLNDLNLSPFTFIRFKSINYELSPMSYQPARQRHGLSPLSFNLPPLTFILNQSISAAA
jgi:hypothetical protein